MEHLKKALTVSVPPEAAPSSVGLVGSAGQDGHQHPSGMGLPQALSVRGGSIWDQSSGHPLVPQFPSVAGTCLSPLSHVVAGVLGTPVQGWMLSLCPGLVALGGSWGGLCQCTLPPPQCQGEKHPMFGQLPSAFLCLCWQ